MHNKTFKVIIGSLFIVFLAFFAVSCKKDSAGKPEGRSGSSQKDILTFEFLKSDNSSLPTDYNTSFTDKTIVATLPAGVNLSALKPDFTVSDKATVFVNGNVQTSRVSANDFTKPVIYTVKAEDGSIKTYTVTVTTQ